MDIPSMLWGINSILLVIIGFFVRMWIMNVREDIADIKEDLRSKADVAICEKIHHGVDQMLHRHASTGNAGEVVTMRAER